MRLSLPPVNSPKSASFDILLRNINEPTDNGEQMSGIGFLNKYTNHLIDWNRVGNLLFTTHRYTPQELLERGFIISSTAALGLLKWNQSSDGDALAFCYGATLGFLMSHMLVISPLIYKRLEAKRGCDILIDKINLILISRDEELRLLVTLVVDGIMQQSHSKSPSAVWGRRKRILATLCDWITDQSISLSTLKQALGSSNAIECLDDNRRPISERGLIL